jgi:hypothetical protein
MDTTVESIYVGSQNHIGARMKTQFGTLAHTRNDHRDPGETRSSGEIPSNGARLAGLPLFVAGRSAGTIRTHLRAALRVGGSVAFLAVTFASCAAPVESSGARTVELGVNLEGINDWSRLSPFADLMKNSRRWGKPNAPWIHEVKTDALGWPTEDAGVVVRVVSEDPGDPRPPNRHLAKGVFRLLFTGRATVRSVASAGVVVRKSAYDPRTDRSTAEVVIGENADRLMLSFVDTHGGVRDVQLLPADSSPGQTFSSDFRLAVAPFGTLRFMDFLRTNGNPVHQWSERTTPAAATQANEKGGAYEYAIQIANELGKDIWINIPFGADDDFVRQLATLLNTNLAPGRVVYVEYSNELWNFAFSQTGQNVEAAIAEAIAGDTTLTAGTQCTRALFDVSSGDCNKWWAGLFRVGKRTVRIARIFSEVFGPGVLNKRVRVVYATQFANPAIAEQVLKNIAKFRGRPADAIYGVAGAPYFALDEQLARSPRLDVDAIHASLQHSLETQVLPYFAPGVMRGGKFVKGAEYRGGDYKSPSLKAVADYYGIRSLAYEGGPDMRQENVSLPAKFAANMDPRMGEMLSELLSQWYGCGNGLFVHFDLTSGYSRHGYWGLTNDAQNLDTAKYRAMAAAARRSPTDYRVCR